MKAATPAQARKFTDIPNVGPRMADDFRRLGMGVPADLAGKDPFSLYRKMCRLSGTRQDPCVLDTYMAAVAFMEGRGAKPWWAYTARRKREHPNL
jgi:hypothetical protein